MASIATLWGGWNDLDAQLISPVVFLISMLLIYHLVLRQTAKPWLAMLAVLLFRCFPYANIYAGFVSDYSLAILFTALCLWGLGEYFREGDLSGLEAAALSTAFAMHLNYMMGILWPVVLIAPFLYSYQSKQPWRGLVLNRSFISIIGVGVVLGIPWYIRNWIVTGNPVYAFFPQIFGGKNINLEVLESCFQEWRKHGDGIGRFGDGLSQKIQALPRFLFRETNFHWKYGPVLTGLVIPGALISLFRRQALLMAALLIFLSVSAYHLILGDLYLYHTLMMVPALTLLATQAISYPKAGLLKNTLVGFILLIAVFVGLSSSIVGGKWMSFQPLAMELPAQIKAAYPQQWQQNLKRTFLEIRLGDSWRMWNFMNENLPPAKVLTHENRSLYLRPDIQLIGLDDCNLTDLYDQPFEKVVQRLREMEIGYYLFVPFENDHPIVKRLGVHGENLRQYFTPVHIEGTQQLYGLKEFPDER